VAAGGADPGASVGSLIVGADVGLGGKLMRTVSFFGWILAASAGLGGNAPPGVVGIFSAIKFLFCLQPKVAPLRCQTRIAANSPNPPSFLKTPATAMVASNTRFGGNSW
jgi:hypothetical protein